MHLSTQLIQKIAIGSSSAFREFYNAQSSRVYNIALSYVQEPELAEEITQDVFVQVWRNASSFKGDAAPETWVYRITINTSLNAIRKLKGRASEELHDEQIEFDHPGILLERKEEARLLFKAIKLLPEAQHTAFILSLVEGLPRQEVADIMEISLKAVESLLQRGKQNLRKLLKPE